YQWYLQASNRFIVTAGELCVFIAEEKEFVRAVWTQFDNEEDNSLSMEEVKYPRTLEQLWRDYQVGKPCEPNIIFSLLSNILQGSPFSMRTTQPLSIWQTAKRNYHLFAAKPFNGSSRKRSSCTAMVQKSPPATRSYGCLHCPEARPHRLQILC